MCLEGVLRRNVKDMCGRCATQDSCITRESRTVGARSQAPNLLTRRAGVTKQERQIWSLHTQLSNM